MTTKDMLEQSERTGELTTEETANVGRTGNGPSQLSAADLAQSGNFCAWDNLTPAQQRMLSMGGWTGYSAQQQQEFMNITVAAEAIGIDLSGLTVSSITIAGQNGATRTELNLTGSSVAVGALNSQLTGSGNFSVNTFLGGLPHSGFTDNFRQMVRFW